jgi:enoyl-CoA hydratase/carnithine racemase
MELNGAAIITVPLLLNREAILDLRAKLGSVVSDRRCIILKGDSDGFCRGLDLTALHSDNEDATRTTAEFAACLEDIRLSSIPVVALVEGGAIGGGVGLAAACDAVIATATSTFALTELLFGLTPAVILPYLALRLPLQKLRWMAMTAEPIGGQRALELGLADICCDPSQAESRLKSLVRRLSRTDPWCVASWKEMTSHASLPGSSEGIQWTASRLGDESVRRRIKDFVDSGQPPWISERSPG